ncbi:hypothetical protein [Tuwongella immobilis]|uniref:Uncharacterized protein n=1 Tax=Tuwongella immobilis TaxID=692036 RepID=A0A6C2YLU2_9BACT|nr:hypothetical protein [Tuwongella immobilis]VIP02550.1 unnamed protein product [Tuwongella immobilis]VTS01739.1 unnamed protein product [Tuwongella immobilis]
MNQSRHRRIACFGLVLAMVAALRLPVWGEQPGATADPAKTEMGEIVGMLAEPNRVKQIFAIDRSQIDRNLEKAARIIIEQGTMQPDGRFRIPVAVGKRVDVVIDLRDGGRIEGVHLGVRRSDFVEADPPLTKSEAEKVRKVALKLNVFENEIDILSLTGNAQYAVALLNKRRTTPFYNSQPGEIIWRLEVWRFEKPEDAEYWLKDPEELFVIHYRERLPATEYARKRILLDAKLGGLQLTPSQKSIDVGTIAIPELKPGIQLRNAPAGPVEKSEFDPQ